MKKEVFILVRGGGWMSVLVRKRRRIRREGSEVALRQSMQKRRGENWFGTRKGKMLRFSVRNQKRRIIEVDGEGC